MLSTETLCSVQDTDMWHKAQSLVSQTGLSSDVTGCPITTRGSQPVCRLFLRCESGSVLKKGKLETMRVNFSLFDSQLCTDLIQEVFMSFKKMEKRQSILFQTPTHDECVL